MATTKTKKEIIFDGLPVQDVLIDIDEGNKNLKVSELDSGSYYDKTDSVIVTKTEYGLQLDFVTGESYATTHIINWRIIDKITVRRH